MIQPSKNKLIPYLIILMGFAAGYLYHSQVGGSEAVIQPLPQAGNAEFKALKSLKVDFAILENPHYKTLQVFGELPVKPGNPGNRDPFTP